MTDAFTPERIAQLREILAKHSPPAVSCAMENLPAALDEIERLSAERDSLIDQVRAMTGVSATLSRVTAERDEAVAEMKRLRGSLEYIKAQSVSKAYATSPAMALNVIRANAEAALDNDFQTTVAEARSFLSRMGGRK
jgi:vacuolar-type H+-ATPase subunit I/STV1